MEGIKLRKDVEGNIINKSNKKNYHITISDNFVAVIEVESYKQYNILDDIDDEDENNNRPFIENYNPGNVDYIRNNAPHGFSRVKCLII